MHEERSAAMAALRYLLFPDQSQASLPQKWKPFHHNIPKAVIQFYNFYERTNFFLP